MSNIIATNTILSNDDNSLVLLSQSPEEIAKMSLEDGKVNTLSFDNDDNMVVIDFGDKKHEDILEYNFFVKTKHPLTSVSGSCSCHGLLVNYNMSYTYPDDCTMITVSIASGKLRPNFYQIGGLYFGDKGRIVLSVKANLK